MDKVDRMDRIDMMGWMDRIRMREWLWGIKIIQSRIINF